LSRALRGCGAPKSQSTPATAGASAITPPPLQRACLSAPGRAGTCSVASALRGLRPLPLPPALLAVEEDALPRYREGNAHQIVCIKQAQLTGNRSDTVHNPVINIKH
jgi:hypothetical protein